MQSSTLLMLLHMYIEGTQDVSYDPQHSKVVYI